MKTFKILRLGIWSLLLATAIVIAGIYVAVQQELLSSTGLKNITAQSDVPATVRSEILVPKVYAAVQQSDVAAYVDRQAVEQIVTNAASDEVLTQKMSPAFTSLEEWINGSRTDIDFSIDIKDIVDAIAKDLTDSATTAYQALPVCTLRNTSSDIQSGTCRPSTITATAFRSAAERDINQAIESADTTITQDSVPYFSSITTSGANLPRFLNIFYAVSLVALAIGVLTILWLLIKHRFAGLTTIGIGVLIAAVSLLLITVISPRLSSSAPESLPRPLVTTAVESLNKQLLQQSSYLAIAGIASTVIGVSFTVLLSRRKSQRATMQFSKK